MNLQNLHNQISEVAPIHGVSIGKKSDKTTWLICFTDEATDEEKAAAQAILAAFNPDLPSVAELWQAAEDYYSGANAPEASRLSKSETDAYSLGIQNYERQAAGKDIIGTMVIYPDNEYMIDNLAWGQSIWTEYYTRKATLEAGTTVSTDFSSFGDKPYTLAQVLAWVSE